MRQRFLRVLLLLTAAGFVVNAVSALPFVDGGNKVCPVAPFPVATAPVGVVAKFKITTKLWVQAGRKKAMPLLANAGNAAGTGFNKAKAVAGRVQQLPWGQLHTNPKGFLPQLIGAITGTNNVQKAPAPLLPLVIGCTSLGFAAAYVYLKFKMTQIPGATNEIVPEALTEEISEVEVSEAVTEPLTGVRNDSDSPSDQAGPSTVQAKPKRWPSWNNTKQSRKKLKAIRKKENAQSRAQENSNDTGLPAELSTPNAEDIRRNINSEMQTPETTEHQQNVEIVDVTNQAHPSRENINEEREGPMARVATGFEASQTASETDGASTSAFQPLSQQDDIRNEAQLPRRADEAQILQRTHSTTIVVRYVLWAQHEWRIMTDREISDDTAIRLVGLIFLVKAFKWIQILGYEAVTALRDVSGSLNRISTSLDQIRDTIKDSIQVARDNLARAWDDTHRLDTEKFKRLCTDLLVTSLAAVVIFWTMQSLGIIFPSRKGSFILRFFGTVGKWSTNTAKSWLGPPPKWNGFAQGVHYLIKTVLKLILTVVLFALGALGGLLATLLAIVVPVGMMYAWRENYIPDVHEHPFLVLVLIGGICGGSFGYYAVAFLQGNPMSYLILWEMLILMHLVLSLNSEQIAPIYYRHERGTAAISSAKFAAIKTAIFSFIALVLPLLLVLYSF